MEKIIKDIKKVAKNLENNQCIKICNHILESRKNDKFHIGIIGEFNRGKTSMINHILELDFLPTDFLPATSKITILEYGETEKIILKYKNKKSEILPINKKNLEKLTEKNIKDSNDLEVAIVKVPHELLESGIVFIDTPGVNDLNQMNDMITKDILPYCDSLLFLLDPVTALTKSESDFLKSNLLKYQFPLTFFILGKADRLNLSDLNASVNGAKKRIKKVLNEDLPVIPFSIKKESISRDKTQKNFDIKRDSLRDEIKVGKKIILKQIEKLVIKGKKNKSQKEKSQLGYVLSLLENDCKTKLEINKIDESKKELILLEAKNERILQKDKFEKFLISIDKVGKKTLKKMVKKSFNKFKRTLVNDIAYQMNRRSNIEDFIDNQLPVYINYQFKKYYENQGEKIEKYLTKFIKHLSKEYTRNFSKALDVAFEKNSIKLPEVSYNKKNEIKNSYLNDISLRVVGGIVGSLVYPGLGTVIGAQFASVIEKKWIEKKDSELRDIYIPDLKDLVDKEFDDYQRKVELVVNQKIEDIKEEIKEFHFVQHDQDLKNEKTLKSKNKDSFNNKIKENLKLINKYKNKLKNI
ncbi:MAG: dynamin family protein [Bacillota bacterium]